MADGHWATGDKLPPEKEIADAVGLSLGTVQKALSRLAADNVVVRRHGHGTFVSPSSQAEQLLHFRFIGDDGVALMPVYAEAIDCTACMKLPDTIPQDLDVGRYIEKAKTNLRNMGVAV